MNNLPIQFTSFIGRRRDIAEVNRLLSQSRLVTLTGAGGCGKTRLALQVAARLEDTYADGVWWIELATLADPGLVPQAAASALGLRGQPDQPIINTLIDYLRPKSTLLLLDNCEHLVDASAGLVDALLHACPNLQVLATSRESFSIAGEAAWTVPSLSLPDEGPRRLTFTELAQYEAVQLFVDRATAVQPSFKLTELNAQAVAQVCQRLDGIPLAIELAAARVKVLQSAEIAARLDDRFRLLTTNGRTALPRHQTLRAAIDWSYDLLSEGERVLLRMAVFAGGCTLATMEQVCTDDFTSPPPPVIRKGGPGIDEIPIVELLSHLVDKSLVMVDAQSRETRYRLLETIRQYARERLASSGQEASIQRRYAGFFTAWVEQMAMELRAGATQLDRFAQLEVEHDNIRATLEWLLGGGDGESGLRLIGAIFYFWWRKGHWVEWGHWMTLAAPYLDHVSESTRAGSLLAMAGWDKYGSGDQAANRRHSREALAIYRSLGDRRNTAWALIWVGCYLPRIEYRYDESMELTEEAIAIMRQEGDLGGVAQGLNSLAWNAERHGDLIRAKATYQETLALAREIGDQFREGMQLGNLGGIALTEGDYDQAAMYLKQYLSWAREQGYSLEILTALAYLSAALGLSGDPLQAARLMGAVDTLSRNWGVARLLEDPSDHDRHVAFVRAELGEPVFGTLWGEGSALTLEQAIEYALEPPQEHAAHPATARRAAKEMFGGLTERERQVAAHIAQGESNREIAEALVVTERTAESHVTNILNKLGFTSRVQIRRWAVEKGVAKPMK